MNKDIPPRIQALINPKHIDIWLTREKLLDLPVTALKNVNPVHRVILNRMDIKKIRDFTEIPVSPSKFGQISMKLVEQILVSARLISEFANTGEKAVDERKIVIAGLDQAGKTAIINSIINMEPFLITTPTMGANVDHFIFAGSKLIFWDLGGQPKFRRAFARPKTMQFSGLSLLIYVIDIQMGNRANEAIAYLKKILSVANFLKQRPYLVIFFHKYDLFNLDFQPILENNKQYLLEQINPLVEQYQTPFLSFNTSIYDIPSLIEAFSRALTMISPVISVLENILEFYCEEQKGKGIILFEENGFTMAEYIGNLDSEIKNEAIVNTLIDIQTNPELTLVSKKIKNKHVMTIEKMAINNTTFYLVTIFDSNIRTGISSSLNLHDTLQPWLANLFAKT